MFLEDAGFDWKILGPDAQPEDLPYVSWQCDQDAYACSGQKCSAQSILFAHSNWIKLGLYERMQEFASRCVDYQQTIPHIMAMKTFFDEFYQLCRRKLEDLTVGPVLSWTTEAMLGHAQKLLTIPGVALTVT